MNWRVIVTDTESATGVAPVCEETIHRTWATIGGAEGDAADGTGPLVFDCCPYPQIETWDERVAERLAQTLTEADAGMAGA